MHDPIRDEALQLGTVVKSTACVRRSIYLPGTLLVALGLGTCFSKMRLRYAISFLAMALLCPTIGIWILLTLFEETEVQYYFYIHVLTWAYLIEIFVLIGLISMRP